LKRKLIQGPLRLTPYTPRLLLSTPPFSLLLILLAWLARLRGLGLHSLWLDEALEYLRASSTLAGVLRSRPVDLDPPLYSLFMHFWLRLGLNDFLLRFPSVIFGVLATALMIVWLRHHGPLDTALIGGLIFALVPVQIHYAQEINQYSLVGLLSVLTLLAFDHVLERGDWHDWGVFALVGAVDLFSYYGLVWLLAALDGYWLARALRRGAGRGVWGSLRALRRGAGRGVWGSLRALRRGAGRGVWGSLRALRRFLACQACFASTALALIPFSLEGHLRRGLAAWSGQYAQLERGDVLWQFLEAIHVNLVLFAIFPFSFPPDALIAAVYTLLVSGVLAAWRSHQQHLCLLLFVACIGPAFAFVASGFGLYPFQGRHLLFAAPALYALLAAGIWTLHRFRPVLMTAVATTAVTLIAFWTIPAGPSNPWLQVTSREELRPVLAQVVEQYRPGDAVYVYYAAHAAYAYYQDAGLAPAVEVFLEDGWPTGRLALQLEHARVAAAGHRRLWLLFAHLSEDEDAALVEALWLHSPHWEPIERIAAENAVAYLLERPS